MKNNYFTFEVSPVKETVENYVKTIAICDPAEAEYYTVFGQFMYDDITVYADPIADFQTEHEAQELKDLLNELNNTTVLVGISLEDDSPAIYATRKINVHVQQENIMRNIETCFFHQVEIKTLAEINDLINTNIEADETEDRNEDTTEEKAYF